MDYNELTRRHFDAPGRVGTLAGRGVKRGAAGSVAQGTWVQFDVCCDGTTAVSRITAVRFLAYGCPHTIAAADWTAQRAEGAAMGATLPEGVHALRARFGMPAEKLGRLLILEDAWIAALSSP